MPAPTWGVISIWPHWEAVNEQICLNRFKTSQTGLAGSHSNLGTIWRQKQKSRFTLGTQQRTNNEQKMSSIKSYKSRVLQPFPSSFHRFLFPAVYMPQVRTHLSTRSPSSIHPPAAPTVQKDSGKLHLQKEPKNKGKTKKTKKLHPDLRRPRPFADPGRHRGNKIKTTCPSSAPSGRTA
jgi:hypothetical protein